MIIYLRAPTSTSPRGILAQKCNYMLFNIDIWHNIAYCVFRIANERTSISLLFEMATDGSAAYSRRIFVRCGSKRGTIHASCGSGGQPACPLPAPRLLFRPFCPKSVPDGSTVSGRPRSNLVKASQTWPCRLAPRPHDPRPRIQDPRPENGAGQARSSPVKVSQGQSNLDPNPLTRCLLSVTGLNRRRL